MATLSFLIPSANTLYLSPPLFPKNLPYIPKCTSSLMPNPATPFPTGLVSLFIQPRFPHQKPHSFNDLFSFLYLCLSDPLVLIHSLPSQMPIHLFSMATTLGQTTAMTLPTGFPPPVPSPPSSSAQAAGGPQMPRSLASQAVAPYCFPLGSPHDLAQNVPFPCTLLLALRPKGIPVIL